MKRDLVIGVVAGLVALVFARMLWPGARVVPPGIYQAQLDQDKHREMMQTLEPVAIATAKAREKLATKIPHLNVKEVPLESLIGYLADLGGIDIHTDWRLVDTDGRRGRAVTLEMRDVTVAQALRAALEEPAPREELVYLIEPLSVRVTTRAGASSDVVTRVYDVRDIVEMIVRVDAVRTARLRPPALPFRPHEMVPKSDGFMPAVRLDFAAHEAQAYGIIAQLIRENVDPASWAEAGGSYGAISDFGTLMVVRQTRANQEDVAILLQWLREGLK